MSGRAAQGGCALAVCPPLLYTVSAGYDSWTVVLSYAIFFFFATGENKQNGQFKQRPKLSPRALFVRRRCGGGSKLKRVSRVIMQSFRSSCLFAIPSRCRFQAKSHQSDVKTMSVRSVFLTGLFCPDWMRTGCQARREKNLRRKIRPGMRNIDCEHPYEAPVSDCRQSSAAWISHAYPQFLTDALLPLCSGGMVYYKEHVVLRRTLGAFTSSRCRSLTLMAASLTSGSLSGPSQSGRCVLTSGPLNTKYWWHDSTNVKESTKNGDIIESRHTLLHRELFLSIMHWHH